MMTKQIELTQGKFALVDDEDFEELNKLKWCANKIGKTYYAERCGEPPRMHRMILGLTKGDGKITDHRNRNGLDNRRFNLRVVSKADNQRNHGGHAHNTSGHNGVNWCKQRKKWRGRIKVMSKDIHLGYFNDIKDAVEARKKGELKYWGGG